MEWRDQGFVLSARPHGEAAAVAEIFTAERGRHAGLVRGGQSRRLAPVLQPGSQVEAVWRARLDEHLGSMVVEPLRARAGIMADRGALAALNAVAALVTTCLAEREPHPGLYAASLKLLDALEAGRDWPALYLGWELALLAELGFGLDLSACATTGTTEDLAYVSPRSARAVSRAAGAPHAERLLPLPAVLRDAQAPASGEALRAGLATTGWFLRHTVAPALGLAALPEARVRLEAAFARLA